MKGEAEGGVRALTDFNILPRVETYLARVETYPGMFEMYRFQIVSDIHLKRVICRLKSVDYA